MGVALLLTGIGAPLLALDERKGGSAGQDAPAGMGLPLRLPHQCSPRQSAPRLPQGGTTDDDARVAWCPTTDQPRLTCVWSVHLADGFGRRPGHQPAANPESKGEAEARAAIMMTP